MCDEFVDPDPVIVVMAVEEKFGIKIRDDEAERIVNMGQLYDFVHGRVARGQPQVCVTSAIFYRLRRALGEVFGVPRECVQLQARLEDLIPRRGRRRCWQELQARLGDTQLPRLHRPGWLVKRIEAAADVPFFIAFLCTIGLTGLFALPPLGPLVWMLAAFAFPIVSIFGLFLVRDAACRRTEHCAVRIPPGCATVRDMVYTLVGRSPTAPMVSDTARPGDKEIWGTLCALVGNEIGQPPDSFTRDSTFY